MTDEASNLEGIAGDGASMPLPSVHVGVPGKVRDLIWSSFFAEAGRGVSFERHLPWHADLSTRTIALNGPMDELVAAAILRPAPQPGVAMVGYVCVAKERRGQGQGRALIAMVNRAADELGYRGTLLWTGKPAVYAGQGYETTDRDRFFTISRRARTGEARIHPEATVWPGYGDTAGLPAFSTSAVRYRYDGAAAIVAQGPRGVTLLDWEGNPAHIVGLLEAAGLDNWSVNLNEADDFASALPADGYSISSVDGAFTMVRRADATFCPDHVPVIHRI